MVMPLSNSHQALHQHCSFQQLYKMIIHRLEAVFIALFCYCSFDQSCDCSEIHRYILFLQDQLTICAPIEYTVTGDHCKSTIQLFDLFIDLLLKTHF